MLKIFLLRTSQWRYEFFFIKEIEKLVEKGVIRESVHEAGEFILFIFLVLKKFIQTDSKFKETKRIFALRAF